MSCSFRVRVQQARQDHELYFASLLPEQVIDEVLGSARAAWQGWIYRPAVVVWCFLSQVLSADHSCRETVARLNSQRLARGQRACGADTSAYCVARDRLPEALYQKLIRTTSREVPAEAPAESRWEGRPVCVVDGSTATTADTKENRAENSPAPGQRPGCGLQFPTNVVSICLERPRPFPYDPAPMLDFEVQRCTRRCARTDRELTPGEPMYSALVSQGAEVVRQDFAADAWNGPPENALGWWKATVPDSQGPKVQWAPNDVMLNYFQQLEDAEDRWDVRYVLALLLIRRRIARLEQTETDASGREVLTLFCPRDEQTHRVVAVMPDQARATEIQQELGKLLFSGGA